MNAIDVDVKDESVLRFILSLPANPDGTQLRVNGKTLFRVFPEVTPEHLIYPEWTSERNARRCALIEKEIRSEITADEAIELEELQCQLRRYRRNIAPLPLAETRRMFDELEHKAAQASR